MPAAEAGELRAACDEPGSRWCRWWRPTTPPERVARIAQAARGFVYVVSVTGVTGERAALPPELGEVVERVRAAARRPCCGRLRRRYAGAGGRGGRIADGVIVGSRLVRAVQEAETIEAGLGGRQILPRR